MVGDGWMDGGRKEGTVTVCLSDGCKVGFLVPPGSNCGGGRVSPTDIAVRSVQSQKRLQELIVAREAF